MDRQYDLFEVLPDGAPVWRGTIVGHENAIAKLRELAKETANEIRVMHLPTQAVIAVMNSQKGEAAGRD